MISGEALFEIRGREVRGEKDIPGMYWTYNIGFRYHHTTRFLRYGCITSRDEIVSCGLIRWGE